MSLAQTAEGVLNERSPGAVAEQLHLHSVNSIRGSLVMTPSELVNQVERFEKSSGDEKIETLTAIYAAPSAYDYLIKSVARLAVDELEACMLLGAEYRLESGRRLARRGSTVQIRGPLGAVRDAKTSPAPFLVEHASEMLNALPGQAVEVIWEEKAPGHPVLPGREEPTYTYGRSASTAVSPPTPPTRGLELP